MEDILREKGYKVTDARVAILSIFERTTLPLSAEEIYKELRRGKKKINEATVYRTLTSFVESNILKRIYLRKDSAYFELAEQHHHHITCTKCERVEDFESTEVEKALEKIAHRSSNFISIGDHSLELFGICKKCS